jgi:Protein of unknown function (DUF4236)/DnaJ domain
MLDLSMPFYLRKSKKVGPFRVTFSNSGVSGSVGIKGARLGVNSRGTYIHLGGGGVYYRQTLSKRQKHSKIPDVPVYAPLTRGEEQYIHSADVGNLVASSSQETLSKVNRATRHFPIFPIVVFVLLSFIGYYFSSWLFSLPGIVLPFFLFWYLKSQHKVHLVYSMDSVAEKKFSALQESVYTLGLSERLWRIISTQSEYDWKRNAGASSNVKRKLATIGVINAPHIKTNVNIYGINFGSLKVFFFPDYLYIFENGKYGTVSYDSLTFIPDSGRFIETSGVPRDSDIVGHTWQYVRRDGGPDRRFANNRQIPIARYGILQMTSFSGLNIHMYVSNEKTSYTVAHVINQLLRMGKDNSQKQTFNPSSSSQSSQTTFNPSGWQTSEPQADKATWNSNSSSNYKGNSSNSSSQKTYQRGLFSNLPMQEKTKVAYKILNLPEGSNLTEVISAYRGLVKKYHPDTVADLAQEFQDLAEAKQKEINEAYSFLRDFLS